MRLRSLSLLLLGSICLLSCGNAEARYYRRGYGGYGGGGVTPQSAAGNAMANIIRAQGMYNVATSRAMVNVEQARGIYLANQQTAMQVYLSRKRAIEAEHTLRREQDRANIQRYTQYMAQTPHTHQLSQTQLNVASGQITWPRALQDGAFASYRTEAEAFFSGRVKQTPTAADAKKMHDTIATMRNDLRNHIHTLNTSDYMEARKFLDGLATESQQHTQG